MVGNLVNDAVRGPFARRPAPAGGVSREPGSGTILGGEPTLHPRYEDTIRLAGQLGYEHVITTSNGLRPARRKFARLQPNDFAYVQISPDGGSPATHDVVRGPGTFDETMETVGEPAQRGFDTRIICTVNKANQGDCLADLAADAPAVHA
ncbi:radical SAM protein [Sphaerisporangium sp. NPDC051017]|uniref:radical SAM protein n=1 Tax=Sphaerisporangium sp. NPDC051017 TaxID=3154636 RepID=UPI003417BDC0